MESITEVAPISSARRLQRLDATRGAAVLGVLLMNIWAFAGPQAFFDYPVAVADWGGAPLGTWAVVHTLFEGSQRALFSILFGAGMVLLVSRLDDADATTPVGRIYYRRVFLLMTFGLFNSFVLLWPADILLTYGLCGLVLYPLRKLKAPVLLMLALVVFGLQAGLRTGAWIDATQAQQAWADVQKRQVPEDQLDELTRERLTEWRKISERAKPDVQSEKIQESIRITGTGSFPALYLERARSSLILQTVVLVNAWLLDALGAMLLGMALFRAGVFALAAPVRTAVIMAMAGYGIGFPLSAWETSTLISADFDPVLRARHLIHYDLRRVAMCLGHLGSLLWIFQAIPGHRLLQRLAATGRMALSNYLAQSVICGLIFYSIGLGLFGRFTGYYLYLVVAAVWIAQVWYSDWWLGRFRFGPAEWLWRSLTYARRQPFRRESSAGH